MEKLYPKSRATAHEAVRSDNGDAPTMAQLTITKVVREQHPIRAGGTMGLGEMIERTLAEMARNGDEVQSLTVDIAPEHWGAFAAHAMSHAS